EGRREEVGSMEPIVDKFGRPIRDLRISVTDRCNFRCTYCMPKEIFGDDYVFLPKEELLTFEEIVRLSELFASLGVEKLRLTGGEPLLRQDLPNLIEKLYAIEGIHDIGLTTNAVMLGKYAQPLFDAGLRRLNISLDALSKEVFGKMNGRGTTPDIVLKNIDLAKEIGFEIKVNMVVQKGVNEREIIPMATYFKERGITLRYIEFMDVGNDNAWSFERVVSKKEIYDMLNENFDLDIVLKNIDLAKEIGFEIKVNMVVQKGVNEREIIPMATYFKERGITLRYIEFMDVGNDNAWSFERVVSKKEIYDMLNENFDL